MSIKIKTKTPTQFITEQRRGWSSLETFTGIFSWPQQQILEDDDDSGTDDDELGNYRHITLWSANGWCLGVAVPLMPNPRRDCNLHQRRVNKWLANSLARWAGNKRKKKTLTGMMIYWMDRIGLEEVIICIRWSSRRGSHRGQLIRK